MIKENKKVDFLTTGRQPSKEEFARISQWIKKDKQKEASLKKNKQPSRKKHIAQ